MSIQRDSNAVVGISIFSAFNLVASGSEKYCMNHQ